MMRSLAILLALAVGSVQGFAPAVRSTLPTTDLQMTVLSYNGKKKDFKAGSPLSKAVAQLGVKVKYSCKKYVAFCLLFAVVV